MWILDELKKRSDSDVTALIHRERNISFQELWEQSEIMAEYFKRNCQTKAPIVIYGNKDIEITVLMLAALKSGRAYVPLDITFPANRVETVMQDVENELLFNFSGETVNLPEGCREIGKRELLSLLQGNPEGTIIPEQDYVQGEDNCYILFTSGSTGKPKGEIGRAHV